MSRRASKGEYEVGFARPPRATRFQPGQSGNPGGRRKASKSLGSVIHAELARKVTVVVAGKRTKITVRDVLAKQLLKKAGEGDLSALKVVLNLDADWLAARTASSDASEESFSKDDEEFMQSFIQQIKDGDEP